MEQKVQELEKQLKEQGHEITRLQNLISENEKKMRQVEEEKIKKDSVIEGQKAQIRSLQQEVLALKDSLQKKTELGEKILELAQLLGQEKENNAELQRRSLEIQKQPEETKKDSITKGVDVVEAIKTNDDETKTPKVDETGTNTEREAIVKEIKVEYNGPNLSVATISQICDATAKVATPGFIKLTNTDRQQRRALKNDLRKYIDVWGTYDHHLEEIIQKSQKEVLRALNISDEIWENSNLFYTQTGNQEVFVTRATLPNKLKTTLEADVKPLDSAKFKEVLRAQVKLLQKEAENLGKIRKYATREEEVFPIIQHRVNDKIFEIYGVEEEHIYGSMKAHMMDPEVQQIFEEIQEVNMRLLLPEL